MLHLILQLSPLSLFGLFFAVLVIAIKLYVVATTGICKSSKKLTGKTVIITGANTGIGKETAKDLASRGAKVILACRNTDKANKAKEEIISCTGNRDVFVKKLDLASLISVRKFASDILKSEEKLDILINNAGCAEMGKNFTDDGMELQMQTNHFGHFLLTNLLLGLLMKTEGSRIINVSALAHTFVKHLDISDLNFKKETSSAAFFHIYSTSKLCNILFTRELARQLQASGKNVTVNALHPGIIQTEFTRFVPKFFQLLSRAFFAFFMKSVTEGAQTTIYLSVADELAGITGEYFSDCKIVKTSKLAQDAGLAKKLWEASEAIVGLRKEEKHI